MFKKILALLPIVMLFTASNFIYAQDGTNGATVTPAVTTDDKNVNDSYDKDGYDKEGYNREGINRYGYDREGNYYNANARNGIDEEKEKLHPRQDQDRNASDQRGTNDYDDGTKPLNEGK